MRKGFETFGGLEYFHCFMITIDHCEKELKVTVAGWGNTGERDWKSFTHTRERESEDGPNLSSEPSFLYHVGSGCEKCECVYTESKKWKRGNWTNYGWGGWTGDAGEGWTSNSKPKQIIDACELKDPFAGVERGKNRPRGWIPASKPQPEDFPLGGP